jgi:hypothetical protein
VTGLDVKGDLHGYLRGARETLVWKLDGLGEYDIRRPLTPTGTCAPPVPYSWRWLGGTVQP